MGILILHISDPHFGQPEDVGITAAKVVASIQPLHVTGAPVVVAITGDIAATGCTSDYSKAERFLEQLGSGLTEDYGAPSVDVCVVPGNHDCNLTDCDESRDRDSLIDALADGKRQLDSAAWDTCVSSQKAYLDFAKRVATIPAKSMDQFFAKDVTRYSDTEVAWHCYNTAFMYRKKQKGGGLFLLPDLDSLPLPTRGGVAIALMHYPPHWFAGQHAAMLQKRLNESNQLILLGHEHCSDAKHVEWQDGTNALVLRGGLFHKQGSGESTFKAIHLDTVAGTVCYWELALTPDRTRYACTHKSKSYEVLEASAEHKAFKPSAQFESRVLERVDAPISHPDKGRVQLSDIYVPPDLQVTSEGEILKPERLEIVRGEKLVDFIAKNGRLLIYGRHREGKTALLRNLFKSLMKQRITPVLLNGEALQRNEGSALFRVIDDAFAEQYSNLPQDLETFKQLPARQKALLMALFMLAVGGMDQDAPTAVRNQACGVGSLALPSSQRYQPR